jgi:myosin-1
MSFRISNILLQANVILESFGNSRTNRNDNSSRFGKYIDLNFNPQYDPIGGQIQYYLLEKSRVVKQQIGERNFHAFYQLLTNESIRFKYGLNLPLEEYHYINQGQCSKVDRINDELNYKQMIEALEIVGFKEEEISTIWKIIAAIIHLVSIN